MDDDQQFCLRWNNHQSTLISVFDTLLEKGIHVDCTLAAEGQTLKAHKVVLSACSPYFENVLSQQYDKHPIIILKDVKYAELRAMMDYMYRGEVNISQDQLAALLKAAESLQIKGLSDNKPARPPGHTPRQPSPAIKGSEGSAGSREGSTSPTRRRKKARRASLETLPVAVPGAITVAPPTVPIPMTDDQPAAELPPAELKVEDGERGDGEGVEDLTMEEENDESLPSHNDVVRNFQWHMERSQDEMMNAEGARDSQGTRGGINVDQPIIKHKPIIPQNASTFAVLRNVILPNEEVHSPKFDEMEGEKGIKYLAVATQVEPLPDHNIDTLKLNETEDETVSEEEKQSEVKAKSRGKHPVKKLKDTEEKPKLKKKPVEWEIITKTGDKVSEPLRRKYDVRTVVTKKKETVKQVALKKKDDVKPITRKSQGDDKRKSVYDFDSLSDSENPLPCAEFKTEKGYKCPNCPRCYNARKNLVRHVTIECGRDPQYECPYCPYSKHRRNEVKKHIQNKHPDQPERLIKRKL